jgi:multiple antibiotic resistance protein
MIATNVLNTSFFLFFIMIKELVALIVMINPFALFLYLQPIMQELDHKTFVKVLFKASLISFFVLIFFVFSGDFLFDSVFQINIEAFRIFGGIIIFSFAYFFIIKGEKAMIKLKGDLDDLASEIALPFMVGAGSISITIFAVDERGKMFSSIIVLCAIVFIFLIILVAKYIRDSIAHKKYRVAFDKNMDLLLRLNGFFVGAIGINMILTGITKIFL